MSAVTQTNTVARVGASTPAGKTQWVERRASRLAVAFSLTQQAAIQEAEKDYWAFRGVGGLCDQCDHTFFCSRPTPGCVRLAPAATLVPPSPATLSKPAPSAAQASPAALLWACKLLIWAVAALVIAAGVLL